MKAIAFVVGLIVISSTAVSRAEGTVGVFFDTGATTNVGAPPLFTTNNEFYLIAQEIYGDELRGFELQISIDPAVLTFGVPTIPLGTPLGPGGTNPYEFIVGFGMCVPAVSPAVLVRYTYGIFQSPPPGDLEICIYGASPSSFDPPVPGYLMCDLSLEPFVLLPSPCPGQTPGCGVIFPTCTVSAETESWGSIKGRF